MNILSVISTITANVIVILYVSWRLGRMEGKLETVCKNVSQILDALISKAIQKDEP